MNVDDPGDPFFSHLDDPTPPTHGDEALGNVMQRGHQIRRRRQAAFSVSTVVVVIGIAGAAIGLTTSNNSPENQIVQPLKSTASTLPSHTASPKRTTTHPPTGIGQQSIGSTPVIHHHHPKPGGPTAPTLPVCTSTTPTAPTTSGPPSTGPTPSDIGTPRSPNPSTSPTPTPAPTCVTPTPTTSASSPPSDSSSSAPAVQTTP